VVVDTLPAVDSRQGPLEAFRPAAAHIALERIAHLEAERIRAAQEGHRTPAVAVRHKAAPAVAGCRRAGRVAAANHKVGRVVAPAVDRSRVESCPADSRLDCLDPEEERHLSSSPQAI